MNNILLGLLSIVITFSLLIIVEKIFKKEGLYVWISIATIIANVIICKSIDVFGYVTNIGNVLFASTFLATDIMIEKYSKEDSKKAILIGVVSQIIFLIMTQYALIYKPASTDLAQEPMKVLFSLNLRVSIASLVMYVVSNLLDIYLYQKLKDKYPKLLWLRNNVSTIISNCLENYIFTFLAFAGIFDIKTMFSIATIASVFEMIIAICDTPFLYISKKLK